MRRPSGTGRPAHLGVGANRLGQIGDARRVALGLLLGLPGSKLGETRTTNATASARRMPRR